MVDANFLARPKFLDHVLRFFPDGAPCHSSLFFNFVDVVARRDETEVAFCEKVLSIALIRNLLGMNYLKQK